MRSKITRRDFLSVFGAIPSLAMNVGSEAQESTRRIGFLTPMPATFTPEQGFELETFDTKNRAEVDTQLHAIPWKEVDALLVGADSLLLLEGAKVAQAARLARLPAIFPWGEYHRYGVLMSYGPNLTDVFRRGAAYSDNILKGAMPSQLPVEQATRFNLIIDSRFAKSIGVKVPEELLYRADQVIH